MLKLTISYCVDKEELLGRFEKFQKECKYKFAYNCHLFRPDIYVVTYQEKFSNALEFLTMFEDFVSVECHFHGCNIRLVEYKSKLAGK